MKVRSPVLHGKRSLLLLALQPFRANA